MIYKKVFLAKCPNLQMTRKLGQNVENLEGSVKLQKNLDQLVGWAKMWQMKFNVDKCKVMHVGVKNRNFEYEMDGAWLQKVEQEKDLGVIINNDLKPTKHCIEVL